MNPKKPRKKKPRLVAKQPSRVHSTQREDHNSLTSESHPVNPNMPKVNQHREKDDDISLKKNTLRSEDNATIELEGLKHHSRNLSQSELHESQQDDQIRSEPEKDHEPEDTMNRSTTNQNLIPATKSAEKQNKTDEHEPETETDPHQISSQNIETCETSHMLTASELVPNVQQPQSLAAASQLHLLTQNGQPMVQYPVQSSEQPGLIQNPQAYNQTWQYQYQNQQNWLQMQQYIQQQQFQPQQQYHQFYQQQEQYHQQYWLQVYQQQQQLQGYNMQMQQYHQMQQQLPKDLHQNHPQQIAVMSNLMRNISHDQQGQGTMPPNSTMPYSQPNPANVSVQSMAGPAPTNIMPPRNHQPPSDSK